MSARRWTIAGACCVALVAVCVALVDRPIAEFVNTHLIGTTFEAIANAVFGAMIPLAILVFVALAGSWLAVGRRAPRPFWLRAFTEVAAAAIIALAVTVTLKFLIGRSQVYPTYIVDHIYESRPFHDEAGWAAFPSATLAITGAILGVLWRRVPPLRGVGTLVFAATFVGILGVNGHWLSDLIAGSFLGVLVGQRIAHSRPGAASVDTSSLTNT